MNIYRKEKEKAISYLFFRYILGLKPDFFWHQKTVSSCQAMGNLDLIVFA